MNPPEPQPQILSLKIRAGWPQRVLGQVQTLPLFDTAGVRGLEAQAMAEVPSHALMHRAGAAVARLALALAPHARTVWIAAGPGNNGGDGLEAAWRLHQAGKRVHLTHHLADPVRLPTDAAQAWARAREAGVIVQTEVPEALGADDLIIDALLGIGGSRAPEGGLAQAIMAIHRLGRSAQRPAGPRILAIDLPSGLQAHTGVALDAEICVRATDTLTLLALKPGLYTGMGRDCAGEVWFCDLGCPVNGLAASAELVGADVLQALSPRRHAQHKGSFGSVWVVGGAEGMQGAATLAAAAALRCGAGRVYVAALSGAAAPPPLWPELMPRSLDLDALAQAEIVTVCGCGGGTAIAEVLPDLLHRAPRLLVDADGLNAIASDPGLQGLLAGRAARGFSTVLTPHPLEAARLLACGVAEVEADRLRAAQALSARYACVALLKGSGSVITAPGALPAINSSGNAALATAGSGDVLAGLIGGLWAQGLSARDATLLATYRHGRVADLSVRDRLVAADLLGA